MGRLRLGHGGLYRSRWAKALVVTVSEDYVFPSRTRISRGHEHSWVGWAVRWRGGVARGSGAADEEGEEKGASGLLLHRSGG
jgi:hypothetical protein